MCEDLAVDPEDVVLLAVAYELKSPRMGVWNRKGWVDGWKRIGYVANYSRPHSHLPFHGIAVHSSFIALPRATYANLTFPLIVIETCVGAIRSQL